MKIVTWNCAGAFRKKFRQLERYNADILVIQECEDPSKIGGEFQDWAQNHLWIGQNKNKGIGVFAQEGISLKKLDWDDNGLQLFLPCLINNKIRLIAVWTKQANSPNFRYIGQFWKYLQLHGKSLAGDCSIICGDFNSNVCWDEWDRWWNHSDVVRQLDDMNIQSQYHNSTKEAQGSETNPTFFMHRKIDKPYHIDYAFSSNELLPNNPDIEIGQPEFWLEFSDHMPLIFTVLE